MAFAKRVFLVAGIYGLVALVPQYFLVERIGRDHPPAITHVEYFYGFVGVAIAWQFVFLLIARDPIRYRTLIPVAMFEKLSFGIPAVWLYAIGRLSLEMLGAGLIDLVLCALFGVAWMRIRRLEWVQASRRVAK